MAELLEIYTLSHVDPSLYLDKLNVWDNTYGLLEF